MARQKRQERDPAAVDAYLAAAHLAGKHDPAPVGELVPVRSLTRPRPIRRSPSSSICAPSGTEQLHGAVVDVEVDLDVTGRETRQEQVGHDEAAGGFDLEVAGGRPLAEVLLAAVVRSQHDPLGCGRAGGWGGRSWRFVLSGS